MYLDEQQIKRFVGTGEVNANGEDLTTFLEKYDPFKYKNPCNTVDTLVFTYRETEGKKQIGRLLLIKRGNHPSIGWWALPGGFVDYTEDIETAALRELLEETGVDNIEVSQLKCYGRYDRDPRARIITTAYVALVPEGSVKDKAGDDASDSAWFELSCQKLSGESVPESNIYVEKNILTLSNPERKLELTADIEVRTRKNALLPYADYQVVANNLIAADHGAIILEGYDFVKRALNLE